jgi:hypothetical protein
MSIGRENDEKENEIGGFLIGRRCAKLMRAAQREVYG